MEKVKELTPRELEVFNLLKFGYENCDIAKKLQISVHTAKAHVCSVIYKLGAKNRTNAAFALAIHDIKTYGINKIDELIKNAQFAPENNT